MSRQLNIAATASTLAMVLLALAVRGGQLLTLAV